MKRRQFIKLMAAVASGVSASFLSCSSSKSKRPNIIFIIADDLGWKDVGFMGSTFYETPHIDKLAKEGMHFTNAYANAPNCAPTRACLMSGQYSPRHGVYTVNSSQRGESRFRKLVPTPNKTVLDKENLTFVEILDKDGYITASIGKWNLGEGTETGPVGQGFSVNLAGNRSGRPGSYFSPYKNPDLQDGPDGEYLTDRLTDESINFIEQNRDKPFFLYLPHYAVHTPLQAHQKLVKKYQEKQNDGRQKNPLYAAMIESMDAGIGKISAKLEELGLARNTVMIFTSDNGGHGVITSNFPLRGSKGMLYEGGIRVPLIVKWPDYVEAGSVCDEPVITLDFYPSLLEMAGCNIPSDKIIDGKSLVPVLTKKQKPDRKALFWHFPAYLQTFSYESPWRTTPAGAVRMGDWKLIEFFEDGKLELYNLNDDISETVNLAEQFPEKLKELYNEMKLWRNQVNAPVPTERNPEYDPNAVYTRPKKE